FTHAWKGRKCFTRNIKKIYCSDSTAITAIYCRHQHTVFARWVTHNILGTGHRRSHRLAVPWITYNRQARLASAQDHDGHGDNAYVFHPVVDLCGSSLSRSYPALRIFSSAT